MKGKKLITILTILIIISAVVVIVLLVQKGKNENDVNTETEIPAESAPQSAPQGAEEPVAEDSYELYEIDHYDGTGTLIWKGVPKGTVLSDSEYRRFEKALEKKGQYINGPLSADDSIEAEETADWKASLQDMILSVNETIPFAENMREYGKMDTYPDGFDNRQLVYAVGFGYGVDSIGYLIWLTRNVFGETVADFEDMISLYSESEKVDISELEIGDIGMIYDDTTVNNVYGIVAGHTEDGYVIMSLCDNTYSKLFPLGSNRLCYIKSENNNFFGASAPVDFRFFFRPDYAVKGAEDEK